MTVPTGMLRCIGPTLAGSLGPLGAQKPSGPSFFHSQSFLWLEVATVPGAVSRCVQVTRRRTKVCGRDWSVATSPLCLGPWRSRGSSGGLEGKARALALSPLRVRALAMTSIVFGHAWRSVRWKVWELLVYGQDVRHARLSCKASCVLGGGWSLCSTISFFLGKQRLCPSQICMSTGPGPNIKPLEKSRGQCLWGLLGVGTGFSHKGAESGRGKVQQCSWGGGMAGRDPKSSSCQGFQTMPLSSQNCLDKRLIVKGSKKCFPRAEQP